MAGASGTPTQGNTGSNVFAVPTQMQNQQMGTLLSTTPQTTTPTTQTSTLPNQQQNTSDITNVLAGGKGGGAMQPQKTAMGTPIVYGNTYLPQSQTVANTPLLSKYRDAIYGSYDGGGGGGLANGTTSVAGYARGTTGARDDDYDPWGWSEQLSAPLATKIEPSRDQPAPRVADPLQQQLGAMALTKGIDATATGLSEGYKAYNAAGPLATSQLASADMALGGLGGTAGAEALAAGSTLAEGGALASALGAGGSAGMTALMATPAAPIVATILAGKLLKVI